MSDEEAILCCVKEDAEHVEGSVLQKADLCEHMVWVSPSGLKVIEEHNGKTTCLECFGGYQQMELSGMLGDLKVTRGQLEELAQDPHVNPLQRLMVMAKLKVWGAEIMED